VLPWLDRPGGRGLPTMVGVSLATTLAMAGAAVAGQAGHRPAAASSTPTAVTATFPAPHAVPPPARPEPNSRPSARTPTRPVRSRLSGLSVVVRQVPLCATAGSQRPPGAGLRRADGPG